MGTLELAAPGAILPQESPDLLDLSVVLPTYNESAHIDAIVEQLITISPHSVTKLLSSMTTVPIAPGKKRFNSPRNFRKSAPFAARTSATCPPLFCADGKSPAATFLP